MEEKLLQDLTCPIGLELFDDPISVPCCGKAINRPALVNWLDTHSSNKTCPLCNGNLSNFDAKTAQTAKILLSFVEIIKAQLKNKNQNNNNNNNNLQPKPKPPKSQEWQIEINKMNIGSNNEEMDIAELKLYLNNCKFPLKQSLFIIIIDKSGSMQGNPWKQVQTAIIHILGITNNNKLIKTYIVTYASNASILNNPNTVMIKSMTAGGGTNFINAFYKIDTILNNAIWNIF